MISLLIVNYRASTLALEAIRTARRASESALQVVVVDNSCDASEVHRLRPAADVVIPSSSNRGYSGGINDGRRHCDGDLIVVANPDVLFHEQSLDRLAAELKDGAAVAGPAFFWDSGYRWFLPPAEEQTRREHVDRALASRWETWQSWRDLRRTRARERFWSDRSTRRVKALSGAVMAIRAEDFDAAGGFDEQFTLYFEETDFLRRIAERGRRIVYVPAARCRHLYNQSAGQVSEESGRLYDQSQRRFRQKWHGSFAENAERWLERAPAVPAPPTELTGAIEVDPGRVFVEASPLPSFDTAAGCFPSERFLTIPPEVVSAYRNRELYIRVVERTTARVQANYVMHFESRN